MQGTQDQLCPASPAVKCLHEFGLGAWQASRYAIYHTHHTLCWPALEVCIHTCVAGLGHVWAGETQNQLVCRNAWVFGLHFGLASACLLYWVAWRLVGAAREWMGTYWGHEFPTQPVVVCAECRKYMGMCGGGSCSSEAACILCVFGTAEGAYVVAVLMHRTGVVFSKVRGRVIEV
jgi:hypothetical protein